MVVVDEERKTLQVVVADDQLSLAIGRGGQNVRLAAELLGWRIDVKSEQKYQKLMEEGFQSLLAVKGVNQRLADTLYDNDITSAVELAEVDPAVLAEILEGFTPEACKAMIEAAKAVPVPKVEEALATGDDDMLASPVDEA